MCALVLPQVKILKMHDAHVQQCDRFIIKIILLIETPPVGQSQNTAVTAIVISTVIAYISSSVLIFIIGCACGWLGHKHRIKGLDKTTIPQAAPGPLYEELQPSISMPAGVAQTFELKENVAYGPVPVRST
jgi:hypothetical protein